MLRVFHVFPLKLMTNLPGSHSYSHSSGEEDQKRGGGMAKGQRWGYDQGAQLNLACLGLSGLRSKAPNAGQQSRSPANWDDWLSEYQVCWALSAVPATEMLRFLGSSLDSSLWFGLPFGTCLLPPYLSPSARFLACSEPCLLPAVSWPLSCLLVLVLSQALCCLSVWSFL